MSFLNKYNFYKNYYLIKEETIKDVLPIVEKKYINTMIKSDNIYKQLDVTQQRDVNNYVQWMKQEIIKLVNSATINKQYQSWLYKIIKQAYIISVSGSEQSEKEFDCIMKKILNHTINKLLIQFEQMCKSPKINREQKNIFYYESIDQLDKFIENNKELLYKHLKINFERVYSNVEYDVYVVYEKDKEQFQNVYGENGYNCGWCIVNPKKNMFEYYLNDDSLSNCYYLLTLKNTTKPVGLIHFGSLQFKDIHNNIMKCGENEYNTLYYLLCVKNFEFCNKIIGAKNENADFNIQLFIDYIIQNNLKTYNQLFVDLWGKQFDLSLDEFGLICGECFFSAFFINNNLNFDWFIKNGEFNISFGGKFLMFSVCDFPLKTLKGTPKEVDNFSCRRCTDLMSLSDGPDKVRIYNCMTCRINKIGWYNSRH